MWPRITTNKKFLVTGLIIIIILIIIRLLTIYFHEDEENLYLALGDSLAYGQQYDGKSGMSYVDILGEELIKDNKISQYSKLFTKPKMTSSELLQIVESNSTVLKDNGRIHFSTQLKRAKYVTISVGFEETFKLVNVDFFHNTMTYDEEALERNLSILALNLFHLVEEIKKDVKSENIILVGYYFPYPTLLTSVDDKALEFFENLNDCIEEVAKDTNTKYVNIKTVCSVTFLPSEEGIYPDYVGYTYISTLIKKAIE